jgi:hypothetical protein
MRPMALLLVLIAMCGCGNRELLPYYGTWSGGFVSEEWKQESDALEGYLHLYAGKQGFKMQMENRAQGIEATGTWLLDGRVLTLQFDRIEFPGPTQEELVALKLERIPPDEIRKALGQRMTFTLSDDGKRFEGVQMDLGSVKGRHSFLKAVYQSNP